MSVRRMRCGKLFDPAARRVQAQLKRFERLSGDHDLAIQHEQRSRGGQSHGEFGEVALERPLLARLKADTAAVAKRQTSKAVVLRLVDPSRAVRQNGLGLGLHRFSDNGNGDGARDRPRREQRADGKRGSSFTGQSSVRHQDVQRALPQSARLKTEAPDL